MAMNLENAKETLIQMKRDLLEAIRQRSEQSNELGRDGAQDSADEANNDNLRNIMIEMNDRDSRKVRLIELALDRIEKGEYETCMECGEPIGTERLEYRPFARYCRDCKEELEQSKEVDD
ncbi:TraR/DksA family transcriptional regulator [Desulfurispirillum indicum]|uniref:Transcriptional regulator, TraR/DksA family n=1 Tax=Desulfurispirillum indicum (strain ATCC BAA-1389 / DSM 22839 / S5) TaxID=653733 RepID=E6W3S7_DESIS|nr:TraR/DksA family transcriptional regulator [Desulfurispirillum indicum]ADU66958.1 transcriptional regulator, TraR/DksA family [Desulfurispirillum indicum S5]UCZ56335.1 TraR/DksA family transcriptional regulator [Desulfurispirillum indicum]